MSEQFGEVLRIDGHLREAVERDPFGWIGLVEFRFSTLELVTFHIQKLLVDVIVSKTSRQIQSCRLT